MTIYLLAPRSEAGDVLTATLDVRRGRTLHQAVDATRARKVGEALLDWWRLANAEWVVHRWRSATEPPERIDLRLALLAALQCNGRTSTACRYLAVEEPPGTRSVFLGPAEAFPEPIGRDLIAWFDSQDPRDRTLRIRLNNSWRAFEVRKRRESEKARRIGTLDRIEANRRS